MKSRSTFFLTKEVDDGEDEDVDAEGDDVRFGVAGVADDVDNGRLNSDEGTLALEDNGSLEFECNDDASTGCDDAGE